ncbi:MAG: IDEAL domain-containing protein, partial [Streptococcus sp.]|nr:IDEAL domain-containing protein [Streptococcus sp.]
PNAYKSMVSFAVLEKNPYYFSEVEEMEVVDEELDSIQKEVLISQLKAEINEALESMDSKRFMELTNRLKELEDE